MLSYHVLDEWLQIAFIIKAQWQHIEILCTASYGLVHCYFCETSPTSEVSLSVSRNIIAKETNYTC